MGAIRITDRIFSVGVINPSLRIFDVIMKTEYGTSYNSYVVKGSEKTAVVEACHAEFFDEYLENIEQAIGDGNVDYIILNHNEPDHSGTLAKLFEKYPRAEVITSSAGCIYLKNITNGSVNSKAVKDNDEISLGDVTLKFISAPFLHWPDSMFTYCREEKAIFTCDFLGCHYCEPTMMSGRIKYKEAYDSSFVYYYNAIFGPFNSFVLSGLDKMKNIELEYVCPSHGPVLESRDIKIAEDKYLSYSRTEAKERKNVSVIYASAYGCTSSLAKAIADGIKSVLGDGADVELFEVNTVSPETLCMKANSSDAFLLGSPTINRDAVAPVWDILSRIDAVNSKNITASAFGSYGWSGEAVPNLIGRMRSLKLKVNDEGFKACFVPSGDELSEAYKFGQEFAGNIK